MKIVHCTSVPSWSLTLHCTNPWCMCELMVVENDLSYGPYPEETLLEGDGFHITCSRCGRKMVVHHTMIYEPTAERLRKGGSHGRMY
ncbi:hypothetical protein CO174_02430 [Candidatus Uhrbacteria bacterium CG_4_9_14_3_um_filter_50_9]|uniref:Uncharacterized protein n=1 Tax=Candidatus Uhrbacteria bacterium CG_4_9_14_3_um_filter_50_9 TaxID=1975035 RepID=A0A2M7XCC1_9BACT|nr:MAG: hypothetical protein CO174_02430 [Candidatus Uhrbacteria bacterium CG_4_9_14_3_um_filter_50_9]